MTVLKMPLSPSVFQNDWLDVSEFDEDSYSINQYLFYTINDCVKLGGRIEWWKADPFGLVQSSVYQATGGVNIFPHANLRVRPEIRR